MLCHAGACRPARQKTPWYCGEPNYPPCKAAVWPRQEAPGRNPMTATTATGALSASDHSDQLRKAVVAATIGTTIEWYDFFLYGTAAGLVFGKLYFPNQDVLTATLAAFGTYFVGFVGRPIGAAIFGH